MEVIQQMIDWYVEKYQLSDFILADDDLEDRFPNAIWTRDSQGTNRRLIPPYL